MESKQIEVQVGKVLSFKPWVGNVKTSQTTCGFTVISPLLFHLVSIVRKKEIWIYVLEENVPIRVELLTFV